MAEKMITVVQTTTFLKLADDFFPKKEPYADTIKPSIDKKPWQFWKK